MDTRELAKSVDSRIKVRLIVASLHWTLGDTGYPGTELEIGFSEVSVPRLVILGAAECAHGFGGRPSFLSVSPQSFLCALVKRAS